MSRASFLKAAKRGYRWHLLGVRLVLLRILNVRRPFIAPLSGFIPVANEVCEF